jgi:hypothetical protein
VRSSSEEPRWRVMVDRIGVTAYKILEDSAYQESFSARREGQHDKHFRMIESLSFSDACKQQLLLQAHAHEKRGAVSQVDEECGIEPDSCCMMD